MRTRHEPDSVPVLGERGLSAFELDLANRIAAEVASRLAGEDRGEPKTLIDAGEVARILGCE